MESMFGRGSALTDSVGAGLLLAALMVSVGVALHLLGQRLAGLLLRVPMRNLVLFGEPKAPAWRRALVLLSGTVASYAFSSVVMFFVATCGGVYDWTGRVVVVDVRPGTPAADAIGRGDVIVSVDGAPVRHSPTTNVVGAMISAKQGAPVRLGLARGGRSIEIELTPQRVDDRWLLGIAIAGEQERARATVTGGAELALVYPAAKGEEVVAAVWDRVFGARPAARGPVGVSTMVRAVSPGWVEYLEYLAFLNVLVMLAHFLPIPPLDGGRLLLMAVRRGR
jgi:membrane-associated protease RseP (regulator of RpoE activity)